MTGRGRGRKPAVTVAGALEGELEAWGQEVAGSTLARQAGLLAARLDAGPTDREVAALSRELRLVLAELRALAGAGVSELEGWLAGISASSLR